MQVISKWGSDEAEEEDSNSNSNSRNNKTERKLNENRSQYDWPDNYAALGILFGYSSLCCYEVLKHVELASSVPLGQKDRVVQIRRVIQVHRSDCHQLLFYRWR